METFDYSCDAATIVRQLTSILDFLDERYEANAFEHKDTYVAIVSELSLCLKDKHNINLLPYLYILRRYEQAHECLDYITNIFYKNRTDTRILRNFT